MTLDSDVTSLLRRQVAGREPERAPTRAASPIRSTAPRRSRSCAACRPGRRARPRDHRAGTTPTDARRLEKTARTQNGDEDSDPTPRLAGRDRSRRSSACPPPGRAWPRAFELVEPQTERTVDARGRHRPADQGRQEFSSLFVANPEVADIEVKSPRLLYLTGVGVGETTLFAVDENDNVLMSTQDPRDPQHRRAAGGPRAGWRPGQAVTATTVDQSLVLTGDGRRPRAGGQRHAGGDPVRRRPDPGGQPHDRRGADPGEPAGAHRRGRRNVDRQLGIRGTRSAPRPADRASAFVGGSAASPGGYRAASAATRGSFSIDVVLQALAEEGLVTILAEPNLTARSGERASFLAGGEYPLRRRPTRTRTPSSSRTSASA